MNESLRMIIVLSLITIISGGSLAFVDNFTKPKIEVNKVKALKEGLKKLIPEADNFEKKEVEYNNEKFLIYKAVKDGSLVGWGFLLSGSGFQDKITIIVAANPKITSLLGIDVLEQKETPGLGAKIDKEDFEKQFKGLSVTNKIGYVKNIKPERGSNNIQALSAATVSTEKVLMIINKNVKKIRENENINKQMRGKK